MIKPCVICGKEFDGRKSRNTCGEECKRIRHRNMRYKHVVKMVYHPIPCKHCGELFTPKRHDNYYCKKEECRKVCKNNYNRPVGEYMTAEEREARRLRRKVFKPTLREYRRKLSIIKAYGMSVDDNCLAVDELLNRVSKLSSPCEAVDLPRAC